jgi:hypothetical protein
VFRDDEKADDQANGRSILVEPQRLNDCDLVLATSSESSDTQAEDEAVRIFDIVPNDSLFPGAAISAQDTRTLLFRLQTRNSWTDGSMKSLFDFLNHILPAATKLGSHREAVESIAPEEAPEPSDWVHCCVNDCCLFEDCPPQFDPDGVRQLADAEECPVCGQPRWDENKKPFKVFRRFNLARQIRRLFLNPKFTPSIRLRKRGRNTLASDLHKSEAWFEKVWGDPEFSRERRNLMMSLCAGRHFRIT